MLRMNSRTEMATHAEMAAPQASFTSKQNFRLLISLSLLLVALVVILVKDREFWFGSEQAVESESASESVTTTNSAAPAKTVQAPATPAATAKNHKVAKAATQPAVTASSQRDAASPVSPVVATSRVVLPPLDVEVVAGDNHRTVHPGSNVAKVEIPSDSNRVSTVTAANMPANAAERERLSNVVIGTDGAIENLTVLSGPAILATAAQQAVRQWRFKPYLQNGQPVETKTKITVNFSIRVADNPATTS